MTCSIFQNRKQSKKRKSPVQELSITVPNLAEGIHYHDSYSCFLLCSSDGGANPIKETSLMKEKRLDICVLAFTSPSYLDGHNKYNAHLFLKKFLTTVMLLIFLNFQFSQFFFFRQNFPKVVSIERNLLPLRFSIQLFCVLNWF